MTSVVWVVGEPGIGKTTFCRKLLASHGEPGPCVDCWTPFGDDCVAAGRWTGSKFDGSDTIPPSKILPALGVFRDRFSDRKVALLDGDKLANLNALKFVADAAPASRLVCVFLIGPASAASGRATRVAAGAKLQNESWVKGRATKSARFAFAFEAFGEVVTIDRDKGETWDGP